jgi:hypothetical protein
MKGTCELTCMSLGGALFLRAHRTPLTNGAER